MWWNVFSVLYWVNCRFVYFIKGEKVVEVWWLLGYNGVCDVLIKWSYIYKSWYFESGRS